MSDHPTGAWELVTAAQHGDQNAFGQLYDRYIDVVFRFVLFRVGDRPLAEDLTSETFLRALRRISSVSYQGSDIGAWFITIARNLIYDHVKSSRYRLDSTWPCTPEQRTPLDPEPADPAQLVVDRIVTTELIQQLRHSIPQLSDDQRDCVELRFMRDLSVSDTAAVMGRNENAVKGLQHRAVRRLAQLLGTHHDTQLASAP